MSTETRSRLPLAMLVLALIAATAHHAPAQSNSAPVDVRDFLKVEEGENPKEFTEFSWPETRKQVQIETPTGLILNGVYGRTPVRRDAPAVVLLHDDGQDHTMFDQFARELLDSGYNVFALDLRGHGESKTFKDGTTVDADVFRTEFGTQEYRKMVDDLGSVLVWIEEQGRTNGRIYLVGSRMGASIAGAGMARYGKRVQRAVLISPIMTFQGISLRDEFANIQGRPYMVVLAESDTAGVEALQVFEQRNEDVQPNPVPHQGVGRELLVYEDVRQDIVDFFHSVDPNWPPPGGIPQGTIPRRVHM